MAGIWVILILFGVACLVIIRRERTANRSGHGVAANSQREKHAGYLESLEARSARANNSGMAQASLNARTKRDVAGGPDPMSVNSIACRGVRTPEEGAIIAEFIREAAESADIRAGRPRVKVEASADAVPASIVAPESSASEPTSLEQALLDHSLAEHAAYQKVVDETKEAVRRAEIERETKAVEQAKEQAERERYLTWFNEAKVEVEKKTFEEVDAVVEKYIEVLARKYAQLVYRDDYGDLNFEGWDRELDAFIGRKLAHIPRWRLGDPTDRITEAVWRYQDDRADDDIDLDEVHDPIEYERVVAGRLRSLGWDARLTPATGDQGADIVADKAGRTLVIQCKRYSQPVGNKAVQEAYAARRHQQAAAAAVVSNAGYTKSARQLASTTGVLLLHHRELATLDDRLGLAQA